MAEETSGNTRVTRRSFLRSLSLGLLVFGWSWPRVPQEGTVLRADPPNQPRLGMNVHEDIGDVVISDHCAKVIGYDPEG